MIRLGDVTGSQKKSPQNEGTFCLTVINRTCDPNRSFSITYDNSGAELFCTIGDTNPLHILPRVQVSCLEADNRGVKEVLL